MVLCELNQKEADALKQFFRGNKQTAIHAQDGYQSIAALLPQLNAAE